MLAGPTSMLPTSCIAKKHLIRRTLLTTAWSLLFLANTVFSAEPLPASLLWRTVQVASPSDQPPLTKKPSILRERDIAFDELLVKALKDAAARPLPPIAVELFDAGRYDLDVVSTLSRINDTSFIRGQLKSPGQGDFSLVLNGAAVTGTVQLGQRLFKIESLGNGRHRLIEIDPEQEAKE